MDERERGVEATTFTTREMLGAPVQELGELQRFGDGVHRVMELAVPQPGELPEEPQVLAAGERRVDPRLLRREPEKRAHPVRVRERVDPTDPHAPAVGAAEAGDDRHERRLARAIRAEEAHDLSRGDVEIDAVERHGRAVGLAQALDVEHGGPVDRGCSSPGGTGSILRYDHVSKIRYRFSESSTDRERSGSATMSAVTIEKLTPERRRQLTRDALVDAAAQVFVSRGFNGASLDEIAETAGFTRGAIYKHFDGKEDLFLAVFDRVNEQTLEAFAEILEPDATTVFFDAPTLAAAWTNLVGQSDLVTLDLEFRLYELRNPSVRERAEAQRRRNREMITQFIEEHAAAAGVTLKIPADKMVSILLATSDGFAHAMHFVPDEADLYEMFLELMIPVLFTQDPKPD